MKKYLLLFFITFLQLAQADVKLPAIVSSNMVLQCNTTITIWGWADAYEEITLMISWSN